MNKTTILLVKTFPAHTIRDDQTQPFVSDRFFMEALTKLAHLSK